MRRLRREKNLNGKYLNKFSDAYKKLWLCNLVGAGVGKQINCQECGIQMRSRQISTKSMYYLHIIYIYIFIVLLLIILFRYIIFLYIILVI